MTMEQVIRCLAHLEAADAVLLVVEDWATAAHLSLVIDRVRASHGLPERPIDPRDLAHGVAWR